MWDAITRSYIVESRLLHIRIVRSVADILFSLHSYHE